MSPSIQNNIQTQSLPPRNDEGGITTTGKVSSSNSPITSVNDVTNSVVGSDRNLTSKATIRQHSITDTTIQNTSTAPKGDAINNEGHTKEKLTNQCPFKFEELDQFFVTSKDQSVSKERLIEILNKISEVPQGEQLLNALKTVLKNKDKTLSFVYGPEYAFQSEEAIRGQDGKELKITIPKEPENIIKRFVFDGQKLVEHSIENRDSESYMISHELVHVISFLESDVMSAPNPQRAWNKRRTDWDSFLSTPRMKPIYDKVLKKLDSHWLLNMVFKRDNEPLKNQIKEAFITLFENTEDARNVLGYATETDKSLIGEYCFFNEGNKTLLPVYREPMLHGAGRQLNEVEKTLLEVMAKEFGINLQAL